jgi:hypothetical protein
VNPLLLNQKQTISVIEAHSLWALLTTKYHAIDNVQHWLSLTHDMDLKKVLKYFLKDLSEHVLLLEKELKKFSIEGPKLPKKHAKGNNATESMSDEDIAINYYTFLQGMIEKALFALQYSIYHDDVSKFFTKFARHAIEQSDDILKYLKVKGWLELPPVYRASDNDRLDCVEAFHLWSHVNYRYINIEENQRWKEYVHDRDFAVILKAGADIMKEQVAMLEKELERYGIPAGKRPPNVIKGNQDKSVFQDEYIYKSLFIGIQWAGVFHAKAFKHCVTNDRIRTIFKSLLYEEIDQVKDMIKYGKLKGWLELPPQYIA